jgi:hypothetical protein
VSEQLTNLLAAGERAVFHGPPGRAVELLEQAMALAAGEGRSAEHTAVGWLLGVALGAQGRLGRALAVLEPLVEAGEAADRPEGRLFGALAGASAASVHRQLGRHAAARELDERGLDLAGGSDEAAFDGHLGLASDAVGLGEREAARRGLAAAEEVVERHEEWWRQRVRLDWLRAEVGLLEDDPGAAAAVATAAVDRAEQARAPRHVAKGLLYQGLATLAVDPAAAVTPLRRAATLADGLGVLPLVWRARALLGALVAESEPAESQRSLAMARSAVLTIAADLPQPLRDEWLGRPDVSALLEG